MRTIITISRESASTLVEKVYSDTSPDRVLLTVYTEGENVCATIDGIFEKIIVGQQITLRVRKIDD